MNKYDFSLLCDFYELTMSNGLFKNGLYMQRAYFDLFYREVPDNGGFAIAAGLEQLVKHVLGLRFEKEDIEFLKSKKLFDEDFLKYLESFKFSGDIYAVPEGTPVFPNEPILTVKASVIEALLIETSALLTVNHQSLIATKANRIVRAARGRAVLEMGARRAQGADGAVLGARAAFIGGCNGTSCALAEMLYGVPAVGTMSHAWVQMFDSEYEAFKTYCEAYPKNAVLLVDTYDTLKSGVPNAIKAFKEVLVPRGINNFAIRLDSGDIASLSKKTRKMLKDAGLENCKIIASNSLDEYRIRELLQRGAQIDVFGAGERLITSKSCPVLGGVYKLAAVEKDNKIISKIKISESETKINNPHFKQVYRIFDRKTGRALADRICIYDEKISGAKPLLLTVIKSGKLVYSLPEIKKIQRYCKKQADSLPEEVKRFESPEEYKVDLSEKLMGVKNELLEKYKMSL